jgi:hypothetical protein
MGSYRPAAEFPTLWRLRVPICTFTPMGGSARASLLLPIALAAASSVAGAQTNALPKWTATQELVIDGSKHELTSLWILTDARSGLVYAHEQQDQTIRVFDPSGNLVRTIGRKGGGPGEFRRMLRSGFVGDSLWVYDGDARRLTVFSPEGRYVRSVKPDDVNGTRTATSATPRFTDPAPRAVYPDGTILAGGLRAAGPLPAGYVELGSYPVIRATTNGKLQKIVFWEGRNEDWVEVRRAKSSAGAALPFPNAPRSAQSVDGAYIAEARAILRGDSAGLVRLTLLRASGDTAYTRTFPASMIPIPQGVLDSAFEAQANGLMKGPLWEELASLVRNAPRPEYYPPLRGLTVARDGALLVAMAPIDKRREYLMFEPDGAPRASFTLPSNVFISSFEGDQIWGTIRDTDDVPSIVRYRLTTPGK